MIDGDAAFDPEGIARLGSGIALKRHDNGTFELAMASPTIMLTQDELYRLGMAQARLSEAQPLS